MKKFRRLVIALVIANLLAVTGVVITARAAADECSPSTCAMWDSSDFFWWWFQCYLPRCPDITVTAPWTREGGRS